MHYSHKGVTFNLKTVKPQEKQRRDPWSTTDRQAINNIDTSNSLVVNVNCASCNHNVLVWLWPRELWPRSLSVLFYFSLITGQKERRKNFTTIQTSWRKPHKTKWRKVVFSIRRASGMGVEKYISHSSTSPRGVGAPGVLCFFEIKPKKLQQKCLQTFSFYCCIYFS